MEKEKRSLFQRFLLWREKNIKEKTVYLDTQLSGRYLYGYYGFDTEDADTLDTEFPDE